MKRLFTLCLLTGLSAMAALGQPIQNISIMPMPKNISVADGSFPLTPRFTVAVKADVKDTILYQAVNRAFQALNRKTTLYFSQQYITPKDNSDTAALIVNVKQKVAIQIGNDESYSLVITPKQISLTANTTAGALHGLETLLQLVNHKGTGYYLPLATIYDSPRFQWRGLMVDVARHFIPLDVLKRNIDAMAAVKLNILHLHLTDDEGFRIESKLFPSLTKAGSNGDYYTQAEMKDLIRYAQARGITIVPEFDMPGHTTSWLAGHPELASAPGPYQPGPRFKMTAADGKPLNPMDIMKLITSYPTPAFDPSKESTYRFLDKFFGEMAALFPAPYIHIGADENNGVAWKTNPSVAAFMKKNNMADTHALQAYFVKRVARLLEKHHKKTLGWEELFSTDLPKTVMVQVWSNAKYRDDALAHGNNVIISKGFYLDVFMPAAVHYNNALIPDSLTGNTAALLKGGEAAQWAEAVDPGNIETRIWPRAAAVAERLWSPASVKDVDDMYRRLFAISKDLDEAGLQHIADYERGLRRLTDGADISPLKTVADVLSPVKGYRKLMARMTKPASASYQTAPITTLSDIIFVDSEVKRHFRTLVDQYLKTKDAATGQAIRTQLTIWKDNRIALEPLLKQMPNSADIDAHSKNLVIAASIGLAALDNLIAGKAAPADWLKQKSGELSVCKAVHGEMEIAVIREIEGLLKGQLAPEPTDYPIF
ncbi:MAG TPA: beta-N-acetylhexosaminidase [Mucilaginibacter sp.]